MIMALTLTREQVIQMMQNISAQMEIIQSIITSNHTDDKHNEDTLSPCPIWMVPWDLEFEEDASSNAIGHMGECEGPRG